MTLSITADPHAPIPRPVRMEMRCDGGGREWRVLDVFSGIGGFALGLQWAGFPPPVAFCEQDAFCQRVLRKHWPDVPIHPDVRELSADAVGPVDLVCGGFPCKQTSVAAAAHGRRSGLAGEDSGLFEEMVRLVGDCRPRWAIIENPLGVASWEGEIARRLEGIGYTVSRTELSAADLGAPHSRRRLFFAANADGKRLEVARPRRPSEAGRNTWRTPPGDLWREVEPESWRMDDGVPHRMDRLNALGNAVVPQIVEMIGRAILKAERCPSRLAIDDLREPSSVAASRHGWRTVGGNEAHLCKECRG